ncbi:MAG: ATP-dependent Clp protease ATP-binding subunit [bacterium]|nr:ATP-dependent Clp protease ATP-binding subunit [bacterium]
MNSFLNEKFSSRAKSALLTAQKISKELKHPNIGTEHLLFGIIREISSFASEVLLKNQISEDAIRLELARLHLPQNEMWQPAMSENLKQTLEKAAIIASKYQYQFIGTEHLLFGIVEQSKNKAQIILSNLNIDSREIRKNLLSIFENVSKFPENASYKENAKDFEEGAQNGSSLEYYTVDLTAKAKDGGIDPLIGREKEVERLISILNRRTKNNPVLIGDPGVGKTAIVEGLALAIHQRNVPDSLLNKRILGLDLALIVAGSMFRGEFENRLKQIIDEIKQAKDIILFIDELHTLVGAGATTGSLDAANILKPALARGELRAIGATTLGEYKKYIEQDAALERRFQPIIVKESTAEETMKILQGLRGFYEAHHELEITDEALAAAVKLSSRFIPDRFLPDKAIDLMDETAAFYKTLNAAREKKGSLQKIERDLSVLSDEKRQAVFQSDFATALAVKSKEGQLQKTRQKFMKPKSPQKKYSLQIKANHIAETVARITGIPQQMLLRKEARRLLALEKNLKKYIVGQDEILKPVASSIRRSRSGIASFDRPSASFMFLGPSGVGKTLMAKLLASEVFQDEKSLIRIDMSEFMERHNVARLIGAPAGYVGYEEGGRLTEAVRRRPYSVLLFDEIEKAHPDVFNLLLQILEEGELTDAAGKKVNFRNTIVVMTSNIGMNHLNKWAQNFGFGESKNGSTDSLDAKAIKQQVMRQLREQMKPEFLNRVDKILVFEPLDKKAIEKIVELELEKIQKKVAEQQIRLEYPSLVVAHLAKISFDPNQGARLVRKNLQDLVEDRIAEQILHGKTKKGGTIALEISNKKGRSIEIKTK